MRCEVIMTSNPRCCVPGDTVARAAKVMKSEDVGSLPVCEDRQGKKLIGMLTDRDLAVRVLADGLDPNQTKVQDVMTRQPSVCATDDDVEDALDSMARYQVRRIPVIGPSGELVGIISQADIAVRAGRPEKTADLLSRISRPATMRA